MKHLPFVLLAMIVASTPALGQAAAPQEFSAASLLSPSIIQSSGHRVFDRVSVREHQFQFEIETKHGTLQASSSLLLEKRLGEIRAIGQAEKLEHGPVALKGAWQTIKETPKGAAHLLSDPFGTLAAAPRGFERMASSMLSSEDRKAGTATQRELAVNLGVDPETRNPVLRHLLRELALRRVVGKTATKFALSAAVPGLGVVSTMEEFRNQVVQRSPHEVANAIDLELARAGIWKPARDQFAHSDRWTSLEKLMFMKYFRQLQHVQHADTMIHLANSDATEVDVLLRIAEMRLLTDLHRQSPIRLISDAGIRIAMLQDGRIFGVCVLDYLTNTSAVREAASGFRKSNPNRSLNLLCTGAISPSASETLTAAQINYIRPGDSLAAPNRNPVSHATKSAGRFGGGDE